jgi:hypothetical protein
MNIKMIKILTIVISIFITIALISFIIMKVTSFMKDVSEPADDGKRDQLTFEDLDLTMLSDQSNHALVDEIVYSHDAKQSKVRYEMHPAFFEILANNKGKVHNEEQPNTFKVYIKFAKRPKINVVTDSDPRHNGKECTVYVDQSLFESVNKIGPSNMVN